MDGIDLIDVLSEDDFLISSSSSSVPDPCLPDLIEQHHVHDCSHQNPKRDEKLENSKCERNPADQVPQLSESPKEKGKSNKINLRKSLAWDSAFFTSEGVLDNEELAMVNSTFQKKELSTLPQIQEELRRSADSSSTLDSDSWALENLETDLFDNLRASIQKSHASRAIGISSTMVSNPGQPSTSLLFRTPGEDLILQMDPFKKPGISNTNKEETHLNGSLSKQLVTQLALQKPANKVGELKLLVKPPRVTSRAPNVTIAPTKRTSDLATVNSRIGDVKVLSGSSSLRQSLTSSKKLQMAARSSDTNSLTSSKKLQMDARNSKTLSIPSLRPPRLSHGNMASPRVSCAPNGKSLDSRSQAAREVIRRKQDPKTASNTSSTISNAPRRLLKDKTVSRNPSSAIQKSLSGSPTLSPTSSLDSMASESSSIFCGSQASYISEGSDFSSSNLSIEPQIDDSQQLELQKTSIAQTSGTNLPNQSRTKACLASSGTTRLSAIDHTRSSLSSSDKIICSKPSGLRMPSPKIGYFDAEKLRSRNKPPHGFPKKTGSSAIARESKLISIKPSSLNAEGGSSVSCYGSRTESTKHVRGTNDAPRTSVPKVSELALSSSSIGKNSNLISELAEDLPGPLNKSIDNNHEVDEAVDAAEYTLADLGDHIMKCIATDPAPNDKSINLVCSGVSNVQCNNSLQSSQAGKEEGKYIPESKLLSVEKSVDEKENSVPRHQTPSTCRNSDTKILDNSMLELVVTNMSSLCLSGKEERSVAEI